MKRILWLPLCLVAACQPREADRFPVVEATIADIQEAILSGRTTCRGVVQAYLERIEAYDQPTALNAITVVESGHNCNCRNDSVQRQKRSTNASVYRQ